MAGRPGPAKLPFDKLSPAGKSQRKNPGPHRDYQKKKINGTPAKKKYRAKLKRIRDAEGLGKAGKNGPVLGHTKSGSIKLTSRKKNSDVSKSRYHT